MRPCGQAGCPELVTRGGYCDRHRREWDRRRRGTAHQRGYTKRWVRYSAKRLSEFPFCAICGRLADVTDHIVPAQVAPARFWDPTNHQSLCGDCNRRKAITESGAFGRTPRQADG
jgi:5-methylcytosine-specific restriction endonuclease McrA